MSTPNDHTPNCDPHTMDDFNALGTIEEYVRQCLNLTEENDSFRLLQAELRGIHEENKLQSAELIALLVINAGLMAFGGAGAITIITAVVRKPRMRTPRNLLTVNLAVCDLTLCLFTQPFNLIRTLHWHYEWRFGEVMCKLTSLAQATNVFVATMSITVIALERFHVIVHPLQSKHIWNRPSIVIPSLWLLGFSMATPMLAFCRVSTGFSVINSSTQRKVCVEASINNPGLHRVKYGYGIFTLICQYFVPFTILLAVYIRICTRIRRLARVRSTLHQVDLIFTTGQGVATDIVTRKSVSCNIENLPNRKITPDGLISSCSQPSAVTSGGFSLALQKKKDRSRNRQRRQRKTNILLTSVSLVFAISWLPLHVVNIFMDNQESGVILNPLGNQTTSAEGKFMGARHITLIQSFCLLCVLFSCCVNPLLYGYLNDNYKKEISETLRLFFRFLCCWCRGRGQLAWR